MSSNVVVNLFQSTCGTETRRQYLFQQVKLAANISVVQWHISANRWRFLAESRHDRSTFNIVKVDSTNIRQIGSDKC